jgi:hypothetical protein
MLAYNLRKVGKAKVVIPLVLLTIVVDAMLFQLAKVAIGDSLLRLLIPNVIAGCVLAYPIWNMYLTHIDDCLFVLPLFLLTKRTDGQSCTFIFLSSSIQTNALSSAKYPSFGDCFG